MTEQKPTSREEAPELCTTRAEIQLEIQVMQQQHGIVSFY